MSQIWLTYEELGSLLNCDPMHARAAAAAIPLDRRKSRDGLTRAKLTPSLAGAFFHNLLRQHLEERMESEVHNLRSMHARMATYPDFTHSAVDRPALPSVLAG